MVDALLDPIVLIALPMAAAFLLPLFDKLGDGVAHAVHQLVIAVLFGLTLSWGYHLYGGAEAYEIFTGGWKPPYGINLRLGLTEVVLVLMSQVTAMFAAQAMNRHSTHDDVRGRVVQLILLLGAAGLIMTRDFFNVFVFIEISGIATYALVVLGDEDGALEAGIKYMLLGSAASIFLLIGVVLLYKTTGTLNIDGMAVALKGVDGDLAAPLIVVFIVLLVSFAAELKLFPLNGPGIDLYEGAAPTVNALLVATSVNGLLYAFYKVLSLFPDALMGTVTVLGLLTFVTANLITNRQDDVRRMLGYSSSGQIGLVVGLAPLVHEGTIPLFAVGLLVVNHTLAKGLLLGMAGLTRERSVERWRDAFDKHTALRLALFVGVLAIVGLPPFPGFFGKWEVLVALAGAPSAWIIIPILLGSALEFAYYFRLVRFTHEDAEGGEVEAPISVVGQVAPAVFALLLLAAGVAWAAIAYDDLMGISTEVWLLGGAGLVLTLLRGAPGSLRAGGAFVVALAAFGLAAAGGRMDPGTLSGLFTGIALFGALVVTLAGLAVTSERGLYHGLLLLLIGSVTLVVQETHFLAFFIGWEVMTWASYMLISQGRKGARPGWVYIVFSGVAGFLLLGGMLVGMGAGATDFVGLSQVSGSAALWAWGLIVAGTLIKSGAVGLHVWAPDAYSESPDVFTPFLSGVLSKVPMFALVLVLASLGRQAFEFTWIDLDLTHGLAWLGALTAFGMTLVAVFQEDAKRLLAYSSLGQVGYIVVGLALMSPLGWTAALYHAVHHLIFKGLLFVAVAAVIHRTGTRKMYELGGLIDRMPLAFFSVMVGIIALSGVPPLGGFVGKWMLYQAIIEKGWLLLAAFSMFSSLLAFLYLYKIVHSIFLGQLKRRNREVKRSATPFALAQLLLYVPLFTLTVWPQALIKPLNSLTAGLLGRPAEIRFGVDFATPLGDIIGTEMTTSLGSYAPLSVLSVVGVVFVMIFVYLNIVLPRPKRVRQLDIVYSGELPPPPEEIHFTFDMHKPTERAYASLLVPRAKAFWGSFADSVSGIAEIGRLVYAGDAQTYILYFVGLAAVLGASWIL